MTVLESGCGDWRQAERAWIARLKAAGSPLTNLTLGGDGTCGYVPSIETRQKMAAAHFGRKQTPESTAKTRAALLGRKQTDAHREALAAIRKGRVPTNATKAAALYWRGQKQTAEHVRKRIAAHIGRPKLVARKLTNEAVREIRASRGTIPQRTLAARFGVGPTAIHEIQHRRHYAEVPDQEDPVIQV